MPALLLPLPIAAPGALISLRAVTTFQFHPHRPDLLLFNHLAPSIARYAALYCAHAFPNKKYSAIALSIRGQKGRYD